MHIPKESEIQKAILQLLLAKRIFVWRQNTGTVEVEDRYVSFGARGTSDILGIYPGGRFMAIEVKRPKTGKLSTEQITFLQKVRKAGGIAMVADCVADVERLLADPDAKSSAKYEALLCPQSKPIPAPVAAPLYTPSQKPLSLRDFYPSVPSVASKKVR
jgi:hypothetical protein